MNTTLRNVILACICLLFSTISAAQDAEQHIVRQTQANLDAFQSSSGGIPAVLPSLIDIPLFDGVVVELQQTRVDRRSDNDITWYGVVAGEPNSAAILVVRSGKITGRIDFQGSLYRISPVEGEVHAITQEDVSLLPPMDNDVMEDEHSNSLFLNPDQGAAKHSSTQPLSSSAAPVTAAPGDPETIDLLAVYSIEAGENYSDIEARIQLAVDYTNQAYENSLIPHRVNLVGIEALDHHESGDSSELGWMNDFIDGRLDEVHDLRQQYNADVISYWAYYIQSYCGVASAILSSTLNATHLTRVSCGGETFAHELGHNQGARHNLEQDPSLNPFPYGHGSGSPTSQWRSIMSYTNACSFACARIPYFSTPLVSYEGEVLGDAERRDNARVIGETGEQVAAWSEQIFSERASAISVEHEGGALMVELEEIFPGIWLGKLTLETGMYRLMVNIDGTSYGLEQPQHSVSTSFRGVVVESPSEPVLLQPTLEYDMVFTFIERYNYIKIDVDFTDKPSMYLRGTPNNFSTSNEMVSLGNDLWVGTMTFAGEPDDRFKFDVFGDWSENYGVGSTEGRVVRSGDDIMVSEAGTYRIYFRVNTQEYWLAKQETENQAPVADAGEDLTVGVGQSFRFDGSGSSDPDGTIESYSWSPVGLTGVNPSYTFDEIGSYTVTLTVTDNSGASSSDELVVNVVESTPWQRTIVFIYGETVVGQDMFIRGGIDHAYANSVLGWNCTSTNYECAIPIRHLNLRNDTTAPWKENDEYLDWYGLEPAQSGGEGSPLDWTTDEWGADWGPKRTYEIDGSGETPLNRWGSHYWILEVEMDCSATVDGWFELKSYISNGPGWENNIQQPNAPWTSANHFAECGKLNVYRRNQNAPVVIEAL